MVRAGCVFVAGIPNPGSSALEADALTTRPTRRCFRGMESEPMFFFGGGRGGGGVVCLFFVLFCFVLFFCVPQLYLWGSPLFFNPIIKVVTFRLRGWCVLGVFLLPAFTRLGHECQDRLRCDRLDLGLYSQPKEFWGIVCWLVA